MHPAAMAAGRLKPVAWEPLNNRVVAINGRLQAELVNSNQGGRPFVRSIKFMDSNKVDHLILNLMTDVTHFYSKF
jgi:hypothetical protein